AQAKLAGAELKGVDVSGAILDPGALAQGKDSGDVQGAPGGPVSPEDIKEILRLHQLWLDSRGAEGQRAVLSERDLSGCDLRKAKLALAVLARAVLRGADLTEASLADLREARLDRADLRGAKLIRAHLSGATLMRANLMPLENVGDRKYDF